MPRTRPRAARLLICLAPILPAVALAGCGDVQLVALERTSAVDYRVATPVRSIVVAIDSGDIELVPGGTRIAVRETRHYHEREPRLRRRVSNGVLTLTSDCDDCRFDLRMAVPAGTAVTAELGSGDIEARGVDVRSTDLQTHSGNVTLELAGRQRRVAAGTDSGEVDVAVAEAREIDARTQSGDVTVAGGRSPHAISASTSSGNVEVSVPAGAYAVDAETVSGDVSVAGIVRDDRAPRTIDASTASGNVGVSAR